MGAQLIRRGDDRLLLAQRIVHVHKRADIAEDNALTLELLIVRRFLKFLDDGRGSREYRGNGDLLRPFLLSSVPTTVVQSISCLSVMCGQPTKAQLRLCVGIFPDHRVVCLDALKLGIVDDVVWRPRQ